MPESKLVDTLLTDNPKELLCCEHVEQEEDSLLKDKDFLAEMSITAMVFGYNQVLEFKKSEKKLNFFQKKV